MTGSDVNIRHAIKTLNDAIAPAPGDFDHPPFDALVSLVDGTLGDVDREIVASHVESCSTCAEDVADMQAVRAVPAKPAAVPSHCGWRGPAVASAIAASLVVAVWIGRERSDEPLPPKVAAAPVAPAPAVSAAPDSLTAEERATTQRAIATGRIAVPASVAELQVETGTLLGDRTNDALIPLAPLGTIVTSAQPEFRWRPVAGARAYSVRVFDQRFKEIASGTRVTSTSWTPAEDLPRDRALSWQVTAHRDAADLVGPAPPQPEARFRVADAATTDRAREQAARLAGRPLELGILYAAAGLIDEASEQLRNAQNDPGAASVARSLLSTLTRR